MKCLGGLAEYNYECTCVKEYTSCMIEDSISDKELIKYFDRVSKGMTNYAKGIMGLPFFIRSRQIKMLVYYLNSNNEIYGLAMGHHDIRKELAEGIIKCEHLKKIMFRITPCDGILEILRKKEGLELIFRAKLEDKDIIEMKEKEE